MHSPSPTSLIHLFALPRRELADGLTVLVASTRRARGRGLSRLDELPRGHALLLTRCRSVHTLGMRFALDLLWLGAAGELVRLDRGVPARRARTCVRANAVIECAAGEGDRFAACLPASAGNRALTNRTAATNGDVMPESNGNSALRDQPITELIAQLTEQTRGARRRGRLRRGRGRPGAYRQAEDPGGHAPAARADRRDREGGRRMDEATRTGRAAVDVPARGPDEIREEIARTREELGETVEALAAKTDVKGNAKARVKDTKERAQAKVEEARETAQAKVAEARASAQAKAEEARGRAQAKVAAAKERIGASNGSPAVPTGASANGSTPRRGAPGRAADPARGGRQPRGGAGDLRVRGGRARRAARVAALRRRAPPA
jgi:uncharacterized membrane protein (UPF0127 family)